MEFEWDDSKDKINLEKHGLSFYEAQHAFFDKKRIITKDLKHSTEKENRYFCFGNINGMIATVRFTIRNDKIRIFGAGFWREGKNLYEKENKIQ